jgi:hypothetical protein
MPLIHKLLSGSGAGLYLPFALSRLRALQALDKEGNFAQSFSVPGYDIRVRQNGQQQFINITATGGSYFEFFATGKPVVTGTVTDDISGPSESFKAVVVGVDLGVANGVVTTDPQILGGKRTLDTSQVSLLGQQAQVNLANEPNACITTPLTKTAGPFPRLLYKSWAPMHSNTGVFIQSYSTQPSIDGGASSNVERDVSYDVPFAFSYGKQFIRYAYLAGASDWPRANAIQVVTDPTFGTREFAIYVDSFNQFWVFPTSVIKSGERGPKTDDNIDPLYVKGVAPVFPGWVFQPAGSFKAFFAANGTDPLVEYPDYDWHPHPDGTRLCAVVWKRVEVAYDGGYFTGLPGAMGTPADAFTNILFNSGYGGAQNITLGSDTGTTRYLIAPGLVESTIAITITGPNPQDFSVSGETTVVRDPETAQFATMLAGYVWHDIPDPYGGTVNVASRGDLCVVDNELYWDNTTITGLFPFATYVKNLTTAKDVIPLPMVRLNDFDMRTLSFVVQNQTSSANPVVQNLRTGYPAGSSGTGPTVPDDGHLHRKLPATINVNWVIAHPQVAVYTFAKLREWLYPPGIPDAQKLSTAQQTVSDSRASQSGMQFLPLNDATSWDATIRNWVSEGLGYTTGTYSLTTAQEAFYFNVLGEYGDMIYITSPRFGFYAYANDMEAKMRKHARSVFFSHPGGSWAYFDSSIIYNKNGTTTGLAFYDSLTPFDASLLSMCVFDRVHLVSGKLSLDTSFIELYNKALTNSRGANIVTEVLNVISAGDLTPTFSKGAYTYTVLPGTTPDDDGKQYQWLELSAQYPNGDTYYIHDPTYITGAPEQGSVAYGSENTNSLAGFGGRNLFDQTMDALWASAPAYVGNVAIPAESFGRLAFSTPTLVVT